MQSLALRGHSQTNGHQPSAEPSDLARALKSYDWEEVLRCIYESPNQAEAEDSRGGLRPQSCDSKQ